MPALGEYGTMGFLVGKPGMVATHSYKHTRQCMADYDFINDLGNDTGAIFGTGAFMLNNNLVAPSTASAKFVGVFLDNEKYADLTAYKDKALITVMTLGDIWVKLDPAITDVKCWEDKVYCIPTAGATMGMFTNVATNNVLVPGRFATAPYNGLVMINIDGFTQA